MGKEDEFQTSFAAATEAGYLHFDTAQIYGNEEALGDALNSIGLAREAVWITTKISVERIALGLTARSFAGSLKKLQTDYVDLLLLHFRLRWGAKRRGLSSRILRQKVVQKVLALATTLLSTSKK